MRSLVPAAASDLDIDVHAGEERLRATLNFAPDKTPAQVLILHGAGPGNRHRTGYLAREIARRGRSTIRFDFSGHGDSSGTLADSSLPKRLQEALTVSALLDPTRPVTVIGNSMGGYVAARLSRHIRIDHLVLMCPAAYAARAEETCFGPAFTAILRQPDSFRTSPTFDDIRAFAGRLSIVTGSRDDVIPDDVIALYRDAATRAGRPCDGLHLDGAPHLLHAWFEQHSADRRRLLDLLDLLEPDADDPTG